MIMETQKNKVCGADIHKKFLIATILSRDGTKITRRFGMILDDLSKFKEWIVDNRCEQVAVESIGTYWIPISCSFRRFCRSHSCERLQCSSSLLEQRMRSLIQSDQ